MSAGLDDDKSDREDSESTQSEFEEDAQPSSTVITPPEETNYVINSREELGQVSLPCLGGGGGGGGVHNSMLLASD